MAVYRQIHISFWQDTFIEELDYKQKYFYLYLLTNSKTKQCGCYEISKKLISYETGLNLEDINNLLKFFIEKNKIAIFKDEILIKNWLKHNSFKSSTIKTCIEKELKEIKYTVFREYIYSILNNKTVCIETIDSLSIGYRQKEKEKEKEKEEKKEEEELKEKKDTSIIKKENKEIDEDAEFNKIENEEEREQRLKIKEMMKTMTMPEIHRELCRQQNEKLGIVEGKKKERTLEEVRALALKKIDEAERELAKQRKFRQEEAKIYAIK